MTDEREYVTVGGIDCGTNSIRLKVARVYHDGRYEDVVPRMLRVVRLGEGVDERHRFADDALERTYEAVREFADVLSRHPVDAVRFVATSATRDAENRDEFEDTVESILGVRPEVISGEEEASMSFLAASDAIVHSGDPDVHPPFLVVDLGGGSTELVLGGDGETVPSTQVVAAYSMNVGCVRMTERHIGNDDPAAQDDIDAINADVDAHIHEAAKVVPIGKAHTIIGVSGTITTMTALAMGLESYDHRAVDDAHMSLERIFATDDRFARMPRAQRAQYHTIHPGRVDVINGGAVVWSRVLTRVAQAAYDDHGQHMDGYVTSEHGLLDGIVLKLGRTLLNRA